MSDGDDEFGAELPESAPPNGAQSSKKTAEKAVRLLVARGEGFHNPTGKERRALAVGFALKGKVLYGKAFDVVRLNRVVDLSSPADISANLDAIVVYEVKSTNRVLTDLWDYFFTLSTAELLVAQSLGDRYRFAFVDTTTESLVEMSMPEVFAKARKIYPTWPIKF